MKKKSLNVKKTNHRKILNHLKDSKIRKIYSEFKSNIDIKKKYAVAVSGGPDSMALVFLSKCLSLLDSYKFTYYMVDHKLRKESTIEAKKVFLLLKKNSIKLKILTWRGKKPSSNIQAIARTKRFLLLEKACKKDGINYLMLGHHIDDLYENFFIRLLRGSGLKGLTSFGKISKYKDNKFLILRPLINLEKNQLLYLSDKVFNFFIEDPSNLKEKFKRVKIRNLITSFKNEGLNKQKLNLTIKNLKDSDRSIKFYVKKNIQENTFFFKKKNTIVVNKFFFEQQHEVIFRSLGFLIKQISRNYYSARGKSIDNLIFKIQSNKMSKTTLGGCYIEQINKTLIISREMPFKK